MKIAFVTSQALSRHATIKRAWGMAPHLLEQGISVAVVAEECPENRAAVESVPGLTAGYFKANLSVLEERRAKDQLLRGLGADFIHICGLGWRNAVGGGRVPGRFLMDHVELESSISSRSQFRRWLQARLEAWSFRRYDGSVAASRYLEHEIRRNLLRRRCVRPILYLPFAFEPKGSQADPRRVEAVRSEAHGRKTIAYMGGLHASYGVRELIAAYRGSPALVASSRLIFFGRGPEADYIRSQAKAPGDGARIEYAGFVDEADLVAHLSASDVLVSPLCNTVQDWARCPSKTFMYMATGRPIVTAPIGENREALGDMGFYYDPGSVKSLATALCRALAATANPPYGLEAHTWAARTHHYTQWLRTDFP